MWSGKSYPIRSRRSSKINGLWRKDLELEKRGRDGFQIGCIGEKGKNLRAGQSNELHSFEAIAARHATIPFRRGWFLPARRRSVAPFRDEQTRSDSQQRAARGITRCDANSTSANSPKPNRKPKAGAGSTAGRWTTSAMTRVKSRLVRDWETSRSEARAATGSRRQKRTGQPHRSHAPMASTGCHRPDARPVPT